MNTGRIRQTTRLLSVILLMQLAGPAWSDSAQALPASCTTDCITPYGQVLGASGGGVEAYSNCRPDCVVYEPYHWNGTYTGIRWQCVEYARRWLLVHKGMVYGDVDIAADIWDSIDHLTHVESGRKISLVSFPNGSVQPPRTGDLLIYDRAFLGTGHVAVVTRVNLEEGHVEVGEQNFSNLPWAGGHARKIALKRSEDGYRLEDAYLIGWKHAEIAPPAAD